MVSFEKPPKNLVDTLATFHMLQIFKRDTKFKHTDQSQVLVHLWHKKGSQSCSHNFMYVKRWKHILLIIPSYFKIAFDGIVLIKVVVMITYRVQEKPVFKSLQPMSFTRNEFIPGWVKKATLNYNKVFIARKLLSFFNTNSHFSLPKTTDKCSWSKGYSVQMLLVQ